MSGTGKSKTKVLVSLSWNVQSVVSPTDAKEAADHTTRKIVRRMSKVTFLGFVVVVVVEGLLATGGVSPSWGSQYPKYAMGADGMSGGTIHITVVATIFSQSLSVRDGLFCRTDIVVSVGVSQPRFCSYSRRTANETAVVTNFEDVSTPGMTCHVQTEMSRLTHEEIVLSKTQRCGSSNL
ncbi:hypothetical protein B0T20DRAFT_118420 [Sordaria brevicollis]|uniref:Uncharacterized protein n=1 Tax=Sordaria brevicollis TaxID=83679 RepID=A0AAE0PKE7_SORBR|nr:hypothetical protein B0T20DRAFT_118420 [Sordaria brevicollis]